MSWSIGYDENWNRDIGYGVPSVCDHPDCSELIDRGLFYVCADSEPRGGSGCGLYFCGKHKGYCHYPPVIGDDNDPEPDINDCCERCRDGLEPFTPKPDTQEWIDWKETDESWAAWRADRDAGEGGVKETTHAE